MKKPVRLPNKTRTASLKKQPQKGSTDMNLAQYVSIMAVEHLKQSGYIPNQPSKMTFWGGVATGAAIAFGIMYALT
jgi:hypothetical protein